MRAPRTLALVVALLALVASGAAQAARTVLASSGTRFELGRLAGKGGFGRVYRGWTLEGARRGAPVAVKLYDSLAGAVTEQGPLGGVGAIAHAPRLVAEGFDERSRRSFLVTPWVTGRTLSRWRKAARPDAGAVVDAVDKAARIVGDLHRAGWLHLDLKPQNLMIDRRGQVSVIDLGTAQRLDADGAATASGAGTRQFMPPEQRAAARIDARADVFALAGTLYALLTNQRPIEKVRQPGVIATRLDRITDPALRAIVQKGLAPEAADRYASADALADALSAWRAGR